MSVPKEILEELHRSFELSSEQITEYERNGFIVLRNIFSSDLLNYFKSQITPLVLALNNLHKPMEERTSYEKAFLQVINLWKHSDTVKEFVFSKRLGSIATQLMRVSGVRLYHDQALYKEPGGGITPWHADQFYWPLASDKCCTVWCPLQDISYTMGPLAFAKESHLHDFGRSVGISDESEDLIPKLLQKQNAAESVCEFAIGDITFHSGWTFHHAGPNESSRPREVMTVIYMDENMRLAPCKNSNQEADKAAFCVGIEEGEIINSPLNGIIFNKTL